MLAHTINEPLKDYIKEFVSALGKIRNDVFSAAERTTSYDKKMKLLFLLICCPFFCYPFQNAFSDGTLMSFNLHYQT